MVARRTRTRLVFGLGLTAVVLALASVAFACTVGIGGGKLVGLGGNGTEVVVGDQGASGAVDWCPSFNSGNPSGMATGAHAGASFFLTVFGTVCPANGAQNVNSKFPKGTYGVVAWTSGVWWTSANGSIRAETSANGNPPHCGYTSSAGAFGLPPGQVSVGALTADLNGNGGGTYSMTGASANGAGQYYGICVNDGNDTHRLNFVVKMI
jgi:hypothetical protein